MKKLKSITEKIFSTELLNNERANRIELTYYSNRVGRYVLLSVCKKAKNALSSSVEWLFNNKDIAEICIQGYYIHKSPFGHKSEHHEFSTTITREELNNAIN